MLRYCRISCSEHTGHRFGFNGQEKVDEISNVPGRHLEFKYRIHDARIGRFLSVDPLEAEYPWNTTYAFAENRVIDGIDLEGREWEKATDADGNVTSASYVGYNEDGSAPAGTVPSVAWESVLQGVEINGNSGATSTFKETSLNVGTPNGSVQSFTANSSGMVELPADNPNATNGNFTVDGRILYGFYNRNDERGGSPEDQWGTPDAISRMINSIVDYNQVYSGDVIQIGDMKTSTNGRPYYSSSSTHHGNKNTFDIRVLGIGGSFKGNFSSSQHDINRSKQFIRDLDVNGFGRIIVGRSVYSKLTGVGTKIKVATDKTGKTTHENHYHVDDF